MRTEFRLLGPIEVRVDGRALPVGHRRQCCVLAALLLDAGQAVPIDELVERVWGERTPQRARETLYCYLSRLRTALAPAGEVRIARQPAGYRLTVDPDAVDVHRFHRLVAAARGSRTSATALDLFEQALGLWRGEPFAVLDTPWLNGMRTALDRARLAAELDRNDVALRSGRHAQVLDAITAAAAAQPMDERLAGQLMRALYSAGQPGEALAAYGRLRTRLADELGIDPGEPLRRLQVQILRADPSLVDTAASAPVPHQVPAPPRTFVGRLAELEELSSPAALSVIVGPGGIGKTWIAQRWAYEHRSRYPDGQLSIDLRGFDPAGPPVFVVGQLFLVTLALAWLWVVGLRGLWRSGRPIWRGLMMAYVLLFALFALTTGAKIYYLTGAYVYLLAAGAVATDSWLYARPLRIRVVATATVVTTATFALLVLPVLPPSGIGSGHKMDATLAETVGWPELVGTVQTVWRSLPAQQQANAVIFTDDYSEAAAVNELGRSKGLPTAVSGQNSEWWWGPGNPDATTVVAVAPRSADDFAPMLGQYFTDVRMAAVLTNPYGVRNIESGGHVYVCTGPRVAWSQLWPRLRHYD